MNLKHPVLLHPSYSYNRKTHHLFKCIDINLTNNKAWEKNEPPTFRCSHDWKVKWEIKRISKKTLVWEVSWKYSKRVKQLFLHKQVFKFWVEVIIPKKYCIYAQYPCPTNPTNVIEEIINRANRCKSEFQLQ